MVSGNLGLAIVFERTVREPIGYGVLCDRDILYDHGVGDDVSTLEETGLGKTL